jgi:TonB family protein
MNIKTIILAIILIGVSILTFGQKTKGKEISIDSLYAKDIQELKTIYPDFHVREMNNDPNEALPPEVNSSKKIFSYKYPQVAKEEGIQGTVYCRFIVDTSGQMKDIRIIKGLPGGCSQEILRVLNEMSKTPMNPYIQENKKVILYQKMYFNFILR